MGLRNYVLKNNEKPATHFVEIFKRNGIYEHDEEMLLYRLFTPFCEQTELRNITPIAIFKIRMK